LPGAFLQNVFLTMNARMWLHLLDVRLKPDAQYEIRWVMELLTGAIRNWIPEIANWYSANRQGKARLAP
jgi:thymidylate synthase ThyX